MPSGRVDNSRRRAIVWDIIVRILSSPPLAHRIPEVDMHRVCLLSIAVLIAVCPPAAAQDSLTLAAAIDKARSANPAGLAPRAGEQEAAARVRQAEAGWLPRIDFTEGVQRGTLPVYVFGSLLSQRRFTEANFALDALNYPDPLTNY